MAKTEGPQDAFDKPGQRIELEFSDFQRLYGNELLTYLIGKATAPGSTWKRDYGSIEAYEKSVEPNRQAWHDVLGRFDADAVQGEVQTEPFHDEKAFRADWVRFEILPGVVCRMVVAIPKATGKRTKRFPVVICQHGIGSSPFHVFGLINEKMTYGAYGLKLARAGFAVVAPVNKTDGAARNKLERVAHIAGLTLFGLETYKLGRIIDYLETLPALDTSRIGLSGISLGGTHTIMSTPIEKRVKAACIIAWFNERRKKMVIEDPKYSCFLATSEEHAFIPGWLPEFSDSDLLSLICPRPVMVQTGKCDGIAWWPYVLEEFERSKAHYEKLGIGERCEMVLHELGHEVIYEPLERFFKKWL